MDDFLSNDCVSFPLMVKKIVEDRYEYCCPTISFVSENNLHIRSSSFLRGVPRFLIQVDETLDFTAYHMGIKVTILSLSRNNVSALKSWSALEEVVSLL